MKILLQLLFSSIFCSFFFAACEKPRNLEVLPSIEDTDRISEFSCLMNGEIWVYHNPMFLVRPGCYGGVCVSYSERSNRIDISTKRSISKDSIKQYFSLESKVTGIGKFPLLWETGFDDSYAIHCTDRRPLGNYYQIDTLAENFIEIIRFEKDSLGALTSVAGYFEFIAVDNWCIDTLIIKDGRFKWEVRE